MELYAQRKNLRGASIGNIQILVKVIIEHEEVITKLARLNDSGMDPFQEAL